MTTVRTYLKPAPPFSIAAALLLWGWQNGFLVFALPMLVIIEMARWVSWRWPVSDREFNILSDLSGIGFFIVVVYIFSTVGARGIFSVLSVMPFILYLLLVVQLYSERGRIGMSSLFISLRKLDPKRTPDAAAELDLSLPYLLLCIISASIGNIRTDWFFVFSFCLVAVVLWTFRPRRYRPVTWVALLGLAMLVSYAGQEGLRDLQRSVEGTLIGLFDQFLWRYRDPDRANTAIGTISRLKQSDRIVLRARTDTPLEQPLYLREASYQQYNYSIWNNLQSEFLAIDQGLDGTWRFTENEQDTHVSLSTYMDREVSVIPVPQELTAIEDITALEITKNRYGTIKMEMREGWIDYTTEYGNTILDSPPDELDLAVAGNYRDDFDRLARELDLYGRSPEDIIERVEQFFADNFTYSLEQRSRYPRGRYLQGFLFDSRSGHCEYFATTTVLLLRMAGIPARYSVGYVVDEFSTIENQYIARSRDAHSWAIAYVNGAWRTVDTTPSVWAPLEDENASILEPLMDLYSWISFRISRLQSQDDLEEEENNYNLLYLLIPLILILAWRLFFTERVKRKKAGMRAARIRDYPGRDSSLYDLVDALNRAGYARRRGETLAGWFNRIGEGTTIPGLGKALALHYRYRFDPRADSRKTRDDLAAVVGDILEQGIVPLSQSTSASGR